MYSFAEAMQYMRPPMQRKWPDRGVFAAPTGESRHSASTHQSLERIVLQSARRNERWLETASVPGKSLEASQKAEVLQKALYKSFISYIVVALAGCGWRVSGLRPEGDL